MINTKSIVKSLLIFAFYFILAAIFTYPLLFKLNSITWGNPGDNSAVITKAFNSVYMEILPSYQGRLLSWLFNPKIAFNLLTFISFPLAGLTMYWLVGYVLCNCHFDRVYSRVDKSKTNQVKDLSTSRLRFARDDVSAFFAGLVFTFSPYHFWQSYEHITLAQIQWLPLFFLALIRFTNKPTPKNGLLLGLAWAINFLTNLHYGYFCLLLAGAYVFSRTATFFVETRFPSLKLGTNVASSRRDVACYVSTIAKSLLPAITFSGLVVLLWHLRSKAGGVALAGSGFSRPLDEIFALSARPWDYLIPAPNHWLWGKAGQELLHNLWSIKKDYRYASPFLPERVIYIGFVPLLLALSLISNVIKRLYKKANRQLSKVACGGTRVLTGGSQLRPEKVRSGAFSNKQVLLLLLTAIAMMILSLPPFFDTSHGRLLLPNYLLAKYFPMVRVYARLGIVVNMLIALLSALGLQKLASKKLLIIAAFALLTIELFLFPHFYY